MKAYVVFGTAGEYSNREEWPVKGFVGPGAKEKAEEFEFACTKWAHDNREWADENFTWVDDSFKAEAKARGCLDPYFALVTPRLTTTPSK